MPLDLEICLQFQDVSGMVIDLGLGKIVHLTHTVSRWSINHQEGNTMTGHLLRDGQNPGQVHWRGAKFTDDQSDDTPDNQ